MRDRISCSRAGARSGTPSSAFRRPTSRASSVRRLRRCNRAVSIASILPRQSMILLMNVVASLAAHPAVRAEIRLPTTKKPRPRRRIAAGCYETGRYLLGAAVRARLAGPLPRVEEAVRKGEIARVQMHGALLANPLFSQAFVSNERPLYRTGLRGVKRRFALWVRENINPAYMAGKNCKFDLSGAIAFTGVSRCEPRDA